MKHLSVCAPSGGFSYYGDRLDETRLLGLGLKVMEGSAFVKESSSFQRWSIVPMFRLEIVIESWPSVATRTRYSSNHHRTSNVKHNHAMIYKGYRHFRARCHWCQSQVYCRICRTIIRDRVVGFATSDPERAGINDKTGSILTHSVQAGDFRPFWRCGWKVAITAKIIGYQVANDWRLLIQNATHVVSISMSRDWWTNQVIACHWNVMQWYHLPS